MGFPRRNEAAPPGAEGRRLDRKLRQRSSRSLISRIFRPTSRQSQLVVGVVPQLPPPAVRLPLLQVLLEQAVPLVRAVPVRVVLLVRAQLRRLAAAAAAADWLSVGWYGEDPTTRSSSQRLPRLRLGRRHSPSNSRSQAPTRSELIQPTVSCQTTRRSLSQ